VSFDGSASSDTDGSITSYQWAFGDGGTASGSTASHSYSGAGTFTATLTITDNLGAQSSTSVGISVSAPLVDLKRPDSLTATLVGRSTVTLNWIDTSTGEQGFYIERTPKSLAEWERVGQVGPNATSYSEIISRGAYSYRVQAFNATVGALSPFSNKVTVRTR
jgi:PKD repeat protein